MGLIRPSYTHLDKTSFRCLFNSLAIFKILHFSLVSISQKRWRSYRKCFVSSKKIIPGFYDKSYKEHLAAIKISSMRYHRMQGHLISMYKILRGDNMSLHNLFTINKSRTRGGNFKLYKPLIQTTVL